MVVCVGFSGPRLSVYGNIEKIPFFRVVVFPAPNRTTHRGIHPLYIIIGSNGGRVLGVSAILDCTYVGLKIGLTNANERGMKQGEPPKRSFGLPWLHRFGFVVSVFDIFSGRTRGGDFSLYLKSHEHYHVASVSIFLVPDQSTFQTWLIVDWCSRYNNHSTKRLSQFLFCFFPAISFFGSLLFFQPFFSQKSLFLFFFNYANCFSTLFPRSPFSSLRIIMRSRVLHP